MKRANEILRDLDGVFPGSDFQHFMWKWSEELFSVIPQYEMKPDGEVGPVYEYRCRCGVDVTVHSADCAATIAKVKMQRVKTCGLGGEFESYSNVWLLCVWREPPTKEEWINSMGTDEDYPSNGRYLPVHRGPMCVAMPRETPPELYEELSRRVVHLMRDHAQSWRDQIDKDIEHARELQAPVEDSRGNVIAEPPKHARYWRIKDRLKEKMKHYNPSGTVGYTGALEQKEN